ncbi:hypothetical protein DPEC_G00169550 [Dallia pectoralis]|uniref:Uncharacterized protein n=1 Tax=Dallia pectoralis TaxID=75939 RepID=A0ACC2GCV2_DALPE|nr:hypothetical protein DPEC_G00169550 [Dallia pectoralis]
MDPVTFVDQFRPDLIERVSMVIPIADYLLQDGMIQKEAYNKICVGNLTSEDRMRQLYDALNSDTAKEAFYKILQKKEKFLVQDLEATVKTRDQADNTKTQTTELAGIKKNISCLLLEILDDLDSNELVIFQFHLRDIRHAGISPIPKCELEKANRPTTVEKMVDRYREDGAVEVTRIILTDMGKNKLASALDNY